MKRLLQQPDNISLNEDGILINKKFSELIHEFIKNEVGFDTNPVDLKSVMMDVLSLNMTRYYTSMSFESRKKRISIAKEKILAAK